jgi:hypothetical protein
MKKRGYHMITVGIAMVCLLTIALMIGNSLRRSSHITLPTVGAASSAGGDSSTQLGAAVNRIEIAPDTVQAAIETLNRPERYARNLTVEWLWSGGSGTEQSTVSVSGGMTRTETVLTSGRTRHVITDGTTTYIWYDSSRTYSTYSAGDISADNEQKIPTYEDILQFPRDSITAADYQTFSDEPCIYVETAEDEDGYLMRYWVSVSSGLLIGAEEQQNETVVYRMAAQPIGDTEPVTADFTLPDGTVLQTVG